MEHTLLWGSFALGALGWLCTLLYCYAPRPSRETSALEWENSPSNPFLLLACALPIVVWLASLPVNAPFSSGQGWGRGFLLGGLGSLAAFLVIDRVTFYSNAPFLKVRVAATSPLFASLCIATIPLIWMRHAVIDALMGIGLGWVATTLVLLLGQSQPARTDDETSPSYSGNGALLLTNGAAFATTVSAVAALGVYRDFVVANVARGTFSTIAITLGSIIALGLLLSAITSEKFRSNRALSLFSLAFFSLVLPLAYGFLLGMKLLEDQTLVFVISAGLLLGLLLFWLVWDEVNRSNKDTASSRIAYVPIWGVLVALGGFMFAYQMMQGFGVGMLLLSAWPVSLLALAPSEERSTSEGMKHDFSTEKIASILTLLLSVVAVLLLSRLFTTRFRADLRGAGLNDQFALFSFITGAAFPALLASFWFTDKPNGRFVSASAGRLGVLSLLALAFPIGILALWGAKVAPALFAGLALSIAGFYPAITNRNQPLCVALFSLATSLTLTQWAHRLAPLAELSRMQRLHILLWVLGAFVFLALLFDIFSRLSSGTRSDKSAPSSASSKGIS